MRATRRVLDIRVAQLRAPPFTHFQYVGAPVRDGAGRWHAWVVYVLAASDPAVVQAWVPAGSLRPAR